jgi:4-hydroxy-2-oxoglutarate aldolase
MILKGMFAPIPTPFTPEGEIAFDALEGNIRHWKQTPLDGLVIAGSNGEWPLLSFSERVELFKACADLSEGRFTLIAGTHCPSTSETAELSVAASEAGCHAVLVLPPHYYKGQNSPEAVMKYFTTVADASFVPVVLYNMPANTGWNLDWKLVSKLSTHRNITGIKDSSGDIVQISMICKNAAEDFSVFAGSGSFLLPSLAVGCSGATMGVANIFPEACRAIFDAFAEGKMDMARRLQLALIDINQAVTKRFGVPGLKAAMDHAGLYGGPPRPPLEPVVEKVRNEIIAIHDEFKEYYEEVSS